MEHLLERIVTDQRIVFDRAVTSPKATTVLTANPMGLYSPAHVLEMWRVCWTVNLYLLWPAATHRNCCNLELSAYDRLSAEHCACTQACITCNRAIRETSAVFKLAMPPQSQVAAAIQTWGTRSFLITP